MTVEIEIFNMEGNLVRKNWVLPGRRVHIPQYLSKQLFYYQVYCARNNSYSSIERVQPAQYTVIGGKHMPMVEREGLGVIVLKPGDITNPLPVRAEEHGSIEHYKFSHKGPKLDLTRKRG